MSARASIRPAVSPVVADLRDVADALPWPTAYEDIPARLHTLADAVAAVPPGAFVAAALDADARAGHAVTPEGARAQGAFAALCRLLAGPAWTEGRPHA